MKSFLMGLGIGLGLGAQSRSRRGRKSLIPVFLVRGQKCPAKGSSRSPKHVRRKLIGTHILIGQNAQTRLS
jgi:hypothetical protein